MKKQKVDELVPVNNSKELELINKSKKLRKLNDINSIDAFEIMDIEEKVDFKLWGDDNQNCSCNGS